METYNKLVRDGVPKHLESNGIKFTSHIATDSEFKDKLQEKVVEEAIELKEAMTKEELADLLEVVEVLKKHEGWSTLEIEEIRLKKLKEKGGFDRHIILEKCEKKAQ